MAWLPAVPDPVLAQLLVNGVVMAALYALLALGFALIYNTTRVFHIAYGASYTLAAYTCYYLSVVGGWPLSVAAPAGIATAAIAGMAMEWLIFAPLERRGASTTVTLLSSLGLYIVIVNAIAIVAGNDPKILSPGAGQVFEAGGLRLTAWQILQVLAAAVVLPGIFGLLGGTGFGRALRAVRDNPMLARVTGLPASSVRAAAFAVGSGLAGTAAVLTSVDVGIDPEAGMSVLLAASVSLVVGGVGTFAGAVLGALLLGLLQSVVAWMFSAQWTDAVTFAVLVAFLALRPEGFLGARRRVEEGVS